MSSNGCTTNGSKMTMVCDKLGKELVAGDLVLGHSSQRNCLHYLVVLGVSSKSVALYDTGQTQATQFNPKNIANTFVPGSVMQVCNGDGVVMVDPLEIPHDDLETLCTKLTKLRDGMLFANEQRDTRGTIVHRLKASRWFNEFIQEGLLRLELLTDYLKSRI
ncbi:hypothetical protein EniLVp02_0078 [Vibrio phage EniLVp02]